MTEVSSLGGPGPANDDSQFVRAHLCLLAVRWRGVRNLCRISPSTLGICDMQLSSRNMEALGVRRLHLTYRKIGRASCRERVCQYVSISVVAVSLKKKIYNY